MSQLRDLAVAHQDFLTAAYLRDLETPPDGSVPLDDIAILSRLVKRDREWARLQQTITWPPADTDTVAKLLADASFVLNTDIDRIRGSHTEHDATSDPDAIGAQYVDTSRTLAHAVKELLTACNQLVSSKDFLCAQVVRLRKQSTTCCFCHMECADVGDLLAHSSTCPKHPAVTSQQVTARQPLLGLHVPVIDPPGSAIPAMVCGNLPINYTIVVSMFYNMLHVKLTDGDNPVVADGTGLNFPEQLLQCVNVARQREGLAPHTLPLSNQPQPTPQHAEISDGPWHVYDTVKLVISNNGHTEFAPPLELFASRVLLDEVANGGFSKSILSISKLIGPVSAIQALLTETGSVTNVCNIVMTVMGTEKHGTVVPLENVVLIETGPVISNGQHSVIEHLKAYSRSPVPQS